MSLTTIEVLGRAADLGLKLGVEEPDTLTVEPVNRCPPDFAETLRVYKPRLLDLLRLPFVMVDSAAIQERLFFCEDDDTRAALVESGADEFSIYTKAELRVLVEQNRVAPLTPDELRKVHQIKRTFSGRITS